MSIEYYVEGNVTTQTEGDQLNFSKGDISINASKNVNQYGKDTGLSFDAPNEIHEQDKPLNTIDVSLNLFFDRTQNNKTNTNLGKDHRKSNHKDDSYTNAYSNIAHGFDAVDPASSNQVKWYIEGIGTDDLKGDDVFPDVALGTGNLGIEAKVVKGCKKGAEAVASKFKTLNKTIDVLTVNVFGFSRGAAAARHFVHIATSPANIIENSEGIYAMSPIHPGSLKYAIKMTKRSSLEDIYGFFGACLAAKGLKINVIQFKFAGLYYTVASFGLNHRGGLGIDGDTKQLNLDAIGLGRVHFVLQIASDDEYRDNFDLTNINSAGLYGLEITLPGVHSDIGGFYVDGEKEISVLYCKTGGIINDVLFNIDEECRKFKQILIEEGWYNADQLTIRSFYQNDIDSTKLWTKDSVSYNGIIGIREHIYSTYDKIPLNQMFHYSNNFGVKYLDDVVKENHAVKGDLLIRIDNQLGNYMIACNDLRNKYVSEYTNGQNPSFTNYIDDIKKITYLDFITNKKDLKVLRNEYLHWSVKANQLGLGAKSQNNAPKK